MREKKYRYSKGKQIMDFQGKKVKDEEKVRP